MYFGEEKKTGFGKAIKNNAGCGILVEKEQEYGIRTSHFYQTLLLHTISLLWSVEEFSRFLRFCGLRSLFFVCLFFFFHYLGNVA